MNVEFLHTFVTVIEAGSIAETARRLDLTAAAVAARLRALEDELGVALVQRSGRSVRPTEAGIKILERARSLLRDVRDLRAIATDSSLTGELRLGLFTSALISTLPSLLQRLYAKHPELAVYVSPGGSVALCGRVSAGELDAAIVVEPQFAVPKTCEWHPLSEEPLVVVAHAGMAGRDPHELLATEPFIRYDRTVLGGQLADRYLRDHGLRPRQRLEIENLLVIAALVDKGLGVSLLPDWPSLWTSGMQLVRLPLPGPVPVRRVGLMLALQSPCIPQARALLQEARVVFAPLAAAAPQAR
ncbi:LysR family transcriptional regulator [Pseudorhodoferax sp.]|uniref:LysR family transcriptional regulator n=1 Tax=Pseudorhodoferax sp. TaxID=1993553 RepID=UPI002DD6506F|nr:LysR family transcriptional regulator [Pseudorhodoferax sp.]